MGKRLLFLTIKANSVKASSPYSAAFTGGGFLHAELTAMLPLLLSPDRDALVKDEILHNNILRINSEVSRKRIIAELRRRVDALPREFWNFYQNLSGYAQKIAVFYVLLKTYRLLFDLHIGVTVRRWQLSKTTLDVDDVKIFFNELASKDEFVSSWSDKTQDKVRSSYMSILRKINILDEKGDTLNRVPITDCDFSYFIDNGENWFLEACLLRPFEIARIGRAS